MAGVDLFIVDADTKTRSELEIVGQACGYRVRSFGDGVSVVTAILKSPPRLILTDLLLPGMDGFELCQRLRSEPKLGKLKILCMSALEWGSVDLGALLKRRFDATFLAKGTLTSELVDALRDLIGEPAGGLTPEEARNTPAPPSHVGSDDAQRTKSMTREFERSVAEAQARPPRREIRVAPEYVVEFRTTEEFATEYRQLQVCYQRPVRNGNRQAPAGE